MRKRKNLAPPLGPDLCGCGALAQTALTATVDTQRRLGFVPALDEPTTLRVCVACYLRAMHEAQARAGVRTTSQKTFTTPPLTGVK
jgi:hypothetical protein